VYLLLVEGADRRRKRQLDARRTARSDHKVDRLLHTLYIFLLQPNFGSGEDTTCKQPKSALRWKENCTWEDTRRASKPNWYNLQDGRTLHFFPRQ
jgi:hypothetical protein